MNLNNPVQSTVKAPVGLKTYPPSILLISDNPTRAVKLQRKLEKNGCQIRQINVMWQSLVKASHHYYDAIILDIERLTADILEVCRELEANQELAQMPVIIVTPFEDLMGVIAKLGMSRPVHYLRQDMVIDKKLLQIIEQIHYLSYRYA